MTSWEESLLSLDDLRFFNLVKNYLITLEAPYSKQDILIMLSRWLGKEENGMALIARLTEREKNVLSLLYYLDEIPGHEFIEALPEEWENWQERLLVYRDNAKYRLTPALIPLLLKTRAVSFERFLQWEEGPLDGDHPLLIDDRLIMGFLAYFSPGRVFYLQDSSPRKRTLDELEQLLPHPSGEREAFFSLLASICLKGGLLREEEKLFFPASMGALTEFATLTPDEKRGFLLSQLGSKKVGGVLPSLIDRLKTDWTGGSLTREGWRRLLYLASPILGKEDETIWADLPRALSLLGLCRLRDDRIEFSSLPEGEEGAPIPLIQPNGDIDLPPGTPFSPAVTLACFPDKGDRFYRFRLTRDSFSRGLAKGMDRARFLKEMEGLSDKTFPANLKTTLAEWEKHLTGVRIVPAVVLRIDGYQRKILGGNPDFQSHIKFDLGDGWFLMDPEGEEEWRALLVKLDMPPLEEPGKERLVFQKTPGDWPLLPASSLYRRSPRIREETSQEELIGRVKEMGLRDEEQSALIHRIERKVIIRKDQVSPDMLRQEPRKAGGLDYNAKLRLIALSLESRYPLLELKIPEAGKLKTLRIIPEEVIKKEGENLLRFREENKKESQEIAVRKILEVIRYHGSLLS